MSDEHKDVQPESLNTTDRWQGRIRFGWGSILILLIGVSVVMMCGFPLWVLFSPSSFLSPLYSPGPFITGTAEIPGTRFERVTVRANADEVRTQQRFSGTVMLRIRDPELRVPPTPEGNRYPTPVTGLSFSYEDFWLDDVR
ncbi:MAG: hypothetical protein JNJ61_05415, partial [Anaerolineae bacterium]|nr:hypothetical protein [Anaerolineae bacterium]